jgi:sugar phosphate isomerase/epimerase
MMGLRMLSRRSFLALSAMALPAMSALADDHIPLGAQIYTVRKMAATNLPETLHEIRQIGYREVELIPDVYHYRAAKLREMIHSAGLHAPSGHFNYDTFPDQVAYAHRLGLEWMVCPMLSGDRRSPDTFHAAAEAFNSWGKLCKKHGMRFAFHNHNYEFQDLNGSTGYDILLRETDPSLVFLELDAYWIAQAGRDPVLMLKQLGKRVKLLHLKDRKANEPTSQELGASAAHFTEVGQGTIDWREVLSVARHIGVEHYFVEQDVSANPMESLRISYEYLHRITS